MRFAPVFVVFLSTLLPAVFSIPVISSERASELSIDKDWEADALNSSRRTFPDSSSEVIERDLFERFGGESGLDIDSRDLTEDDDLYRRARGAAKVAKKAAKAVRVQKAASKGKVTPKRPANAKVTFGNAAKAKLDELGLHGKDRKKVKKYHKDVIKKDMKNHGAHSARVLYVSHPSLTYPKDHLAHEGGNDPNEKNHITAGYYKAPAKKGQVGEQIKSPWAVKHEKENPGKVTKGLFHVYPSDKKKVPSAWTKAAAASTVRKQAEADRLKAEADAAAHAKNQRVEADKAAGGSLSAEAKKAQREAAKAAKAAKKKGTI
ncbi:hypothetical protein CVT25_002327 [Psilocybe cyanescens]|uniref:Uncharacterized protein n=1 Tax=Psilocybe cyanescens TaxID=93625 RepID=A0A409WKH7_PSICY|nr:hypothetical protein CVT25_002327 [Psilocybe cyanescens]